MQRRKVLFPDPDDPMMLMTLRHSLAVTPLSALRVRRSVLQIDNV